MLVATPPLLGARRPRVEVESRRRRGRIIIIPSWPDEVHAQKLVQSSPTRFSRAFRGVADLK
jgi:hypothetical protein